MERKRPKWSPGGPNGAQEAQMEPWRPKVNSKQARSVPNAIDSISEQTASLSLLALRPMEQHLFNRFAHSAGPGSIH